MVKPISLKKDDYQVVTAKEQEAEPKADTTKSETQTSSPETNNTDAQPKEESTESKEPEAKNNGTGIKKNVAEELEAAL
jgi:hypothetical protein